MPDLISRDKKKSLGGGKTSAAKKKRGSFSEGIMSFSQNAKTMLDNPQGDLNVQLIPIKSIVQDELNPRNSLVTLEQYQNGPKINNTANHDWEIYAAEVEQFFKGDADKVAEYLEVAELALSIGAPSNLINPITVHQDGMRFHLIAGHRRTLAHYILGSQQIIANILVLKPEALALNIIQWDENHKRKDLQLDEVLTAIGKIVKSWEVEQGRAISIRQLAKLANIKRTKAQWLLTCYRLLSVDNAFHQAISSRQLRSLEIAYKIASIEDLAEREKAYQLLLHNKSYGELKTKLRKTEKKSASVRKASQGPRHLNIRNQQDITMLSKITQVLSRSEEISEQPIELSDLNLNTKDGIMQAWDRIITKLSA